jgi:hypothetical protein
VSKPDESSDPHPTKHVGILRSLRRFIARDAREHFWDLLDYLDARPALRRTLLFGVPIVVLGVGLGFWGYQRWASTNSVRIARQWLDAGRLERAGIAIQDALATEPGLPASWRLASELAWRKGNKASSVEYAKKAAIVGHYQAEDVLAWAEASILAGDTAQAQEAEGYLDHGFARESARALRLAGEIARRALRFADARDSFQAALEEDTKAGVRSLAVDEVPLGIVCLQTESTDDRSRGQALLVKWASDPDWGVDALRALLADAVAHQERKEATRWAEDLRKHPRCTLGDIPVCLRALSGSDPERYHAMLAQLEDKGRSSPTEAAQLLGWLVEIGQGAEAVRWGESLDPILSRKPPVTPGIAEALRATHRWADLQAWVDRADWGPDLGFLGWAYGFVAYSQLGDGPKAAALWQRLATDGQSSAAHALFAGDALYAWGYTKEAATLLWAAADRPDLAYQALGSLVRLYQLQRDASGQCRAFGRLNTLRPADRDIANNYAYFAALTGEGGQLRIMHIAQDNFEHEPANIAYRTTYAFVLVWTGQASQALTILGPVSGDWRKSSAVAFAYGAALAGLGRQSEAKEVFASLDPRELDPREAEWIKAELR